MGEITMEKVKNTAIVNPCPCAGVEGHHPNIALRHWDQCSGFPVDWQCLLQPLCTQRTQQQRGGSRLNWEWAGCFEADMVVSG